MLPAGVVGIIAVGVDGRVVRSAKARVPFLARLTGQGVESGVSNPLIIRYKVSVLRETPVCCAERDGERSRAIRYARDYPVLVFRVKP